MEPEKDEKAVTELLQDMCVKLRDMDDFSESLTYKKIITKFQRGYEEEYQD